MEGRILPCSIGIACRHSSPAMVWYKNLDRSSSVLSQSARLTNGRTDGQTESHR